MRDGAEDLTLEGIGLPQPRPLRSEAAIEQEEFLRAPHSDHARQEPGVAAIGRQAERSIADPDPDHTV